MLGIVLGTQVIRMHKTGKIHCSPGADIENDGSLLEEIPLPPGNSQCLESFLPFTSGDGGGGVLLASSGGGQGCC